MSDPSDEVIRLLHVEDEPDFAEMSKVYLERENDDFDITTANSAKSGLEALDTGDFDCIVSDYNMPKMDGIGFLQAVRADYPDIPFILYTGRGSEEIASEAISAGVTDYLQKESGSDQYTVLANRIENAVTQYRTEQEIEETTQWYSTILKHSSDYVMIVDEMGQVDYISPAVERVLGYTSAELEAMNAFEYVHPDDHVAAGESLTKNIEEPDREHTVEFRAQHADGEWRWLEVRGRNLLDDPIINGIMVNVRDITTRKRREQDLKQQKERLEKLTSFISHDVRNQLSIIEGNITLAEDQHESEHLETARAATNRIDRMLEQIEELSRSSDISPELTPVSLVSIAETCWHNVSDGTTTIETDGVPPIEADEDRLRNLFENLFLNAIEHGDADTITVGELDGGFYVADDGKGLETDDPEQILDPDYTTSNQGTGFGLAIVEEIAGTHEWSIDVRESDSGGVRFEFTGVDVAESD